MSQQYGRRWRVTLFPKGNGEAITIDNSLRVSFDCEKSISDKPNQAKIMIYNLSLSNIEKALNGDFKRVVLSVGYHSLNQLFIGDITKASVKRADVDFILTLECADGFAAYKNGRIKISLERGATDKDIIKNLTGTFPGIRLGQMEIPNLRKLPRGKVLNGDTRELLNKIANNSQADWCIQDNEFIFLPKNKVLKNQAVVLSQESGMIGSPERTDDGLELNCLLNTELKIGGLVQVKSIIKSFDGFYKIVKVKHTGDSHSNDWKSQLTVVAGNYTAVKEKGASNG